jgi:hypothetical protein
MCILSHIAFPKSFMSSTCGSEFQYPDRTIFLQGGRTEHPVVSVGPHFT